LVKLLVKLQAVPCQRNVTGGSILLAHPAHTHWRRGTGIGGVPLDDDQAPREAVLTQVIRNAGPNDASSNNDHVCCVCHVLHTSSVPLYATRTRHGRVIIHESPASSVCQHARCRPTPPNRVLRTAPWLYPPRQTGGGQ